MLARFLYGPSGRIRPRRLIATLAVTIGLALFGSFLIALTPAIHHPTLRGAWVLFAVFVLKFPLVLLLWWFIWRNREWPIHPPRWSEDEVREILRYLVSEADRATALDDAPARLAYLSREAWHVADRAEGSVKVDAVDVALHVDQVARRHGLPARLRRP